MVGTPQEWVKEPWEETPGDEEPQINHEAVYLIYAVLELQYTIMRSDLVKKFGLGNRTLGSGAPDHEDEDDQQVMDILNRMRADEHHSIVKNENDWDEEETKRRREECRTKTPRAVIAETKVRFQHPRETDRWVEIAVKGREDEPIQMMAEESAFALGIAEFFPGRTSWRGWEMWIIFERYQDRDSEHDYPRPWFLDRGSTGARIVQESERVGKLVEDHGIDNRLGPIIITPCIRYSAAIKAYMNGDKDWQKDDRADGDEGGSKEEQWKRQMQEKKKKDAEGRKKEETTPPVDTPGEPAGMVMSREARKNRTRELVKIFIFAKTRNDMQLLGLQQPGSGKIGFIEGARKHGDRDTAGTARRRLREVMGMNMGGGFLKGLGEEGCLFFVLGTISSHPQEDPWRVFNIGMWLPVELYSVTVLGIIRDKMAGYPEWAGVRGVNLSGTFMKRWMSQQAIMNTDKRCWKGQDQERGFQSIAVLRHAEMNRAGGRSIWDNLVDHTGYIGRRRECLDDPHGFMQQVRMQLPKGNTEPEGAQKIEGKAKNDQEEKNEEGSRKRKREELKRVMIEAWTKKTGMIQADCRKCKAPMTFDPDVDKDWALNWEEHKPSKPGEKGRFSVNGYICGNCAEISEDEEEEESYEGKEEYQEKRMDQERRPGAGEEQPGERMKHDPDHPGKQTKEVTQEEEAAKKWEVVERVHPKTVFFRRLVMTGIEYKLREANEELRVWEETVRGCHHGFSLKIFSYLLSASSMDKMVGFCFAELQVRQDWQRKYDEDMDLMEDRIADADARILWAHRRLGHPDPPAPPGVRLVITRKEVEPGKETREEKEERLAKKGDEGGAPTTPTKWKGGLRRL